MASSGRHLEALATLSAYTLRARRILIDMAICICKTVREKGFVPLCASFTNGRLGRELVACTYKDKALSSSQGCGHRFSLSRKLINQDFHPVILVVQEWNGTWNAKRITR